VEESGRGRTWALRAGGSEDESGRWATTSAPRTWIATAAAVAVLLLAGVGAARTIASPELSRLATAWRGTPVSARCATTQAEWAQTLVAHRAPPYVVAFAYIGDARVWLSPSICAGVTKADPWGVLVFLHELVHTSGVRGERAANCRALAGERRFLETLLGLDADRAQAVYEQSLARALAEPERYRPIDC
jgi:hypothetical protein